MTDASKTAMRLVAVAKQEEENSSDPAYRQQLHLATQSLESGE